ncbi:hypothetical protein ACHAWO_010975 [Cyclotella atomus]|uniref:Uncharacterized protein n=1 Tax=Cyclotella atomus TaxID=382360 RepID=A0ABD3N868_9STRA
MQPGNINSHDVIWPLLLNGQQLPLHNHPSPSLLNVNRFVYPKAPSPLIYPTIPVAHLNYARVDNPTANPYTRGEERKQEPLAHSRLQLQVESTMLPKLTIAKLKSYIKPVNRHTNHEIDLPKELEPYFGKGWTCRYYHSTPAWGFIPPKGSGLRRADGFKALMARLELLDYRKKNKSEETCIIPRIPSNPASAFTQSMQLRSFERENMLSKLYEDKGSDLTKRKRDSSIHIDHQGITIKKARMVSQEDVTEVQQPKVADFTNMTSRHGIFKSKSSTSTDSQDLPHQVTFETNSSQDEGSVGPPKKRFLLRNERDSASGIGLLAHAASLL